VQAQALDFVGHGAHTVAELGQMLHEGADGFSHPRLSGPAGKSDAAAVIGGGFHGCPAF
jgi:hypothetical protein